MHAFEIQREKRLLFAEEIRKRDRSTRISQMREDSQIREIREEVWGIINSFTLERMDLTEVVFKMRNNKAYEVNGSAVFAEWLNQEDRELKIEGKIQNCLWGTVLEHVATYHCEMLEKIICFYLPQILNVSIEQNNFKTVFTVLLELLQNREENPNLWGEKEKIVGDKILEMILLRISDSMLKDFPITVYELRVFNILHAVQFESFLQIVADDKFLQSLCHTLKDITQLEVMAKAIHLMIIISCYDGKNYYDRVEKLIEMDVLENLSWVLEFVEPNVEETKRLTLLAFTLITYIAFDFGAQVVFEKLLLTSIIRFTDFEEYDWEIVKAASICLASIIQSTKSNCQDMKVVGDQNIIDIILNLMNMHGDEDGEFVEKLVYGLENILSIGQEEASNNEISPYLMKIEQNPNFSFLKRFDKFQQLIDFYKEDQENF